MTGSIIDIHQTKQLEEDLRRSNTELEEYSYIASHDLKEPLRTLKTFTSYLLKEIELGNQERVQQDKVFIEQSCDRMTRLIDDLLKFSRAGSHEYSPVECNLEELIDEVRQSLATLIQESEATISLEQPVLTVYADSEQLILALQNLIQNAIKFRKPSTQPNITITTTESKISICLK